MHSRSGSSSSVGRVTWSVPLGRLLGRSSRWAMDELGGLVSTAKDLVVGIKAEPRRPRPVRSASPLPTLVADLAALVARSSSRSLQDDKRFWGLVRELYARRPWVPRVSSDMIDTAGVEVKKASSSHSEPTVESDGERTAH